LENEFQIYPYNDAYHFMLHVFFMSHWGFEVGESFNQPIWSVSVEIFIYIVFFALLKYIFRAGVLGPLLMMALFLGLIVFQVPGRFWETACAWSSSCAAARLPTWS
jgi:peptidoglycan/LPS O-acetylase OafA/YrhL